MAGENDPTTKFRRNRGVSKVIDELTAETEFECAPATKKEDRAYCKYCDSLVPGRSPVPGSLDKHNGPCGLPCLGGGVEVGRNFHCDRCVICSQPDEFPEGTRVP